jgi:hypothetical protein
MQAKAVANNYEVDVLAVKALRFTPPALARG